MPIFEYVCSNCGSKFEKLILSASRERHVRCPECSSADIEKAISLFFGTTRSSESSVSSVSNCAPSG